MRFAGFAGFARFTGFERFARFTGFGVQEVQGQREQRAASSEQRATSSE